MYKDNDPDGGVFGESAVDEALRAKEKEVNLAAIKKAQEEKEIQEQALKEGKPFKWIKGKDLVQQVSEGKTLWEIFRDIRADNAHIKDVWEIMCMAIEEWHKQHVDVVNVTNCTTGIEYAAELQEMPDYTEQSLRNLMQVQYQSCTKTGCRDEMARQYMVGMYNGLALAYSTYKGEEPVWFDDIYDCEDLRHDSGMIEFANAVTEGLAQGLNQDTDNPLLRLFSDIMMKEGLNQMFSENENSIGTMMGSITEDVPGVGVNGIDEDDEECSEEELEGLDEDADDEDEDCEDED